MPTMPEAIKDFLGLKCIALVGVSRTQNKAANLIYRKLRSEGYKVFAINPNATSVKGDSNYPNLKSLPDKPDAVVMVTRPEITDQVVQEWAELSIGNVWMHRGPDSKGTSVSVNAVDSCHKHDTTVISGRCPMMYCANADIGRRIMRWMQNLTGILPKQV